MANGRSHGAATLLDNGTVLVTGGAATNGAPLASAEVYNPTSASFAPAGSMTTAREYHTATRLNSGMVLIVGGQGSSTSGGTAEVY